MSSRQSGKAPGMRRVETMGSLLGQEKYDLNKKQESEAIRVSLQPRKSSMQEIFQASEDNEDERKDSGFS